MSPRARGKAPVIIRASHTILWEKSFRICDGMGVVDCKDAWRVGVGVVRL
jgi:hypothetical protein